MEDLPEAYYKEDTKNKTVLTQWQQDERAEAIIRNTSATIEYLPQNKAVTNYVQSCNSMD